MREKEPQEIGEGNAVLEQKGEVKVWLLFVLLAGKEV